METTKSPNSFSHCGEPSAPQRPTKPSANFLRAGLPTPSICITTPTTLPGLVSTEFPAPRLLKRRQKRCRLFQNPTGQPAFLIAEPASGSAATGDLLNRHGAKWVVTPCRHNRIKALTLSGRTFSLRLMVSAASHGFAGFIWQPFRASQNLFASRVIRSRPRNWVKVLLTPPMGNLRPYEENQAGHWYLS